LNSSARPKKTSVQIENIDDIVGAIRALLDQLDLSRNTIFVFMADNGSSAGSPRPGQASPAWKASPPVCGLPGPSLMKADTGFRFLSIGRPEDGRAGSILED
jgi:arylsulfatase A-like enzyme